MHILCVALFLPRTPDIHCKQQYEILIFQQQKLHQIIVSFVHTCYFRRMGFVVEFDVVNKEKCLQLHGMPCAQHSLRNVYSYMESHVLSTVFIQSICRKHPRLRVSICSLLLLSSIDAITGMDKMFYETILF